MSKKIFVSYSRIDIELASSMVADIEGFGHTTWMDHKLTGGEIWWDKILANIRAADLFLFALSPDSSGSVACLSEYEYAGLLGTPVLPVLLRPGVSEALLPPALGNIHRVDYAVQDKAALGKLIKAIDTTPLPPELPDPLPASPSIPATYLFDILQEVSCPEGMGAERQDRLVDQIVHQIEAGIDLSALEGMLAKFRLRDDLLVRTSNTLDQLSEYVEGQTVLDTDDYYHQPPSEYGGQQVVDPYAMQPADVVPSPQRPAATPGHQSARQVNAAWWIAPVLFAFFGGLIAWLANKDIDSNTARNMLITGIVMTFLLPMLLA